MAFTFYAVVKSCYRLDRRCFLGLIVFILLNINFIVLMVFNVNQVDPRNKMIFAPSKAASASNPIEVSPSYLDNSRGIASLPSFTWDKRDMILGAIIERSSTSAHLSLTVIALNRNVLAEGCDKTCPWRLSEKANEMWQDLSSYPSDKYDDNGKRVSSLKCRISNGHGFMHYSSAAVFVSNSQSKESGANGRLDVFRCPMRTSWPTASSSLIRSNDSVFVSLFRDDSGDLHGQDSVLNFTVPWATRRTGFMLGVGNADRVPQSSNSLDKHMMFSDFDAWSGYKESWGDGESADVPERTEENSRKIVVRMCVTLTIEPLFAPMAGGAAAPSVPNIAQLLEFVEHHLLLGVSHIFLAVRYAHDSDSMRLVLLTLRHRIESGHVTVVTQAAENIDRTASLFGLSWTSQFLTLYHRTAILFLLKGHREMDTAGSYLAMWGLDGMLVPERPVGYSLSSGKTIQDVILVSSSTSRAPATVGQLRGTNKGMSGHLPCFLTIRSRKVIERFPGGTVDIKRPWLRDRFAVGESFVLDPIAPPGIDNSTWTNMAYGARWSLDPQQDLGLIVEVDSTLQPAIPRALVLGCGRFVSESSVNIGVDQQGSPERWFPSHYQYDETGGHGGEEGTNYLSQAVLFRYMAKTFRYDNDLYTPAVTSSQLEDYVALHSDRVMQDLRRHNLDLMVLVVLSEQTHVQGVAEEHWPKYKSSLEEQ